MRWPLKPNHGFVHPADYARPDHRFDIWPYLERFALDAETEILVEMGGKPDLIIGNYRCVWMERVDISARVASPVPQ